MGIAPHRIAPWLADLFFFSERRRGFTRWLGHLHKHGAHLQGADSEGGTPAVQVISQQSKQNEPVDGRGG